MSQLTICLIISLLTFISYLWGKLSLATTAMASMLLFLFAGCVDAGVITSSFGNTTGLMMVAMFVVGEGFNRTQFIKNLASGITKVAKGSFTKVMIGYIILAVLMCQFIPSNLVPFLIISPLLAATVAEMDISPSKVMFSLGITVIITCQTLPLGSGATQAAQLNGYLSANGSDAVMSITDPMKARIPLLAIIAIYSIFIAPRLAPSKPITSVQSTDGSAGSKALEKEKLKPLQEKCGYLVFFAVSLALLVSEQIGIEPWQIAIVGAVLMVITGVLTPKQATQAMPIGIYLLFVGSIVMANALNLTGAGNMIGDMLANIAGTLNNTVLIYLMFFIAPFILTQFIFNRTSMMIFYPIIIQTCISLGANPIGPVICVQAACYSSFITPMATGTVPYMMGAGGYDIRSLLKQAALPTALCCVVTVFWMSIAFPLF